MIAFSGNVYVVRCYKLVTNTCDRWQSKGTKCLRVDDVGLYVTYKDESELVPNFIRRHLVGRERESIYLVAESPEDLLQKFYALEAAQIGGSRRDQKALSINESEPILQLPVCRYMVGINEKGEFFCGSEFDHWPSSFGSSGGICDDGDGWTCEIDKFLTDFHKANGKTRCRLIPWDGTEFKFVGPQDVPSFISMRSSP